jgi:hypothetical protein
MFTQFVFKGEPIVTDPQILGYLSRYSNLEVWQFETKIGSQLNS